ELHLLLHNYTQKLHVAPSSPSFCGCDDGQSTEVDTPPAIIDVPDKDDDIIDDEDAFPHDLADFDDEDLIDVDDDGVDKMLHGPTAVSVAVRIVPFHTMCPPVAGVASLTETQFDLRSKMKSPDWTKIDAGIQHHMQKAYNTNKAAFKAQHWVIDPDTGTYNVEKIRQARSEGITAEEWDKQSSGTQEYPSLIDTFFVAHTVNGEEMGRLEATGTYTDDEINRLARRGKQLGHIPGVDRVLPARVTADPSRSAPESTLKNLHKKVDFMMRLFKSYSEYSDAFSQFESVGASGSGGSGGCGDDEESVDDQEGEDEGGDGDS
nr:F-box domain, leucine-rich repeat domain, L domain-like protein [Tanacetum cinerariifolium]